MTEDWKSLTDDDRDRAFATMPDMLDGFMKLWGWLHFAKAIEQICREKNSGASGAAQDAAGPLTGTEVCAEFDALSERMGSWNNLCATNAAWHAFKCGVRFAEKRRAAAIDEAVEAQQRGSGT